MVNIMKRVFGWMKNNPLVLAVLGSLIAAIIIDISEEVGMSLSKAFYGFLITISPSDALELFFFFLFIVFLILAIRKRGHDIKRRCDKLFKLTKLPKTFDRAITVEQSPDYPAIITNHYGKFPHLRFGMRVINRTYYPYEAEEAVAKCCCGREEVYKGTWDINTKKSETFELVTNLSVWGEDDGVIRFRVPIKKIYDDMTAWRLRGKVKYKSREPLIEDDTQYVNPKIDIDIVYMLSKKQISELKKEVEKALGGKEDE